MYIYKVHVTNMLNSKMHSECELTLVNMKYTFSLQQKREKRAFGNWKLLIKGLLIKERIKKRFNLIDKVPVHRSNDSSIHWKY